MSLFRSLLSIIILAVVGLTAPSEIGANIAPLLAGAGIIRIAIGFGSQKLVQDVITGPFLLLESAIQVGDCVTVAGLSGSVENLSIRAIRLRAGDASVHIVPFGSVTSVTNSNRGIGDAAVSVSVAYEEDTDRVGLAFKQIAVEMHQEMKFKSVMLAELQLWGVDKVDGASTTIVGQIACTDAGRWDVQREFNRSRKQRFQALDIVIAAPNQSKLLQQASRPPPSDDDFDQTPASTQGSNAQGDDARRDRPLAPLRSGRR